MKTSTPVRINLALSLGAAVVLLVAVGPYSTIHDLINDPQRSLKVQQTSTLLERVERVRQPQNPRSVSFCWSRAKKTCRTMKALGPR